MDFSPIDRLFDAWSGPASPGVAWAVLRDGTEIHHGAVGMSDIAQQVPMDRRSVVRIGSQTKQFTVLLALMLEAEGRLSMEDEVHRHAPWLPRYPWPITLRHLATNTSGLRDFLEIMTLSGIPLSAPASRARQREMIAAHGEVNFEPGTQMIYCNTGFWLLSEIIEEVSGRSFNELLETRITGPLGMADTRLLPLDTQIVPRLSAQHTLGPDGAWQTARWGWAIGGEGGMVSTIDDMLTWQRNLAEPRVGSAGIFARMATPIVYANGTSGLYGMGLTEESYRGLRAIGHGGSVAGGRSVSMRFPEIDGTIVMLANLAEIAPHSLALRIADTALADRLAPRVETGARQALAAMRGRFREVGGDDILAIEGDGATLAVRTAGGSALLDEIEAGVFAPERPTTHLRLAKDGDGLRATWCGAPRRYVPVLGDGKPDFSGRYRNDATGQFATVDGNVLTVGSASGRSHLKLRAVDPDLMLGAPGDAIDDMNWTCTLRRDGAGLVLSTDRTKGLRFTPDS